jgi:hypothetical protein
MKRYNSVEFSMWVCEACALGMIASALCLILDAIHKYCTL